MRHRVVKASISNQYRIQWPDGALSKDTYNLSHANQHCRDLNDQLPELYSYLISQSGRTILQEIGVRNIPKNRPLYPAQSLTDEFKLKVQ